MQITTTQLQTDHNILIDALRRGELVEITDHGHMLGIAQPAKKISNSVEQLAAMDAFFGIHKDQDLESVEEELRLIRQGRRA
jgi:antitoxin (DNA-binding transcriptional repressor) of toxin-antitoxin stability system